MDEPLPPAAYPFADELLNQRIRRLTQSKPMPPKAKALVRARLQALGLTKPRTTRPPH